MRRFPLIELAESALDWLWQWLERPVELLILVYEFIRDCGAYLIDFVRIIVERIQEDILGLEVENERRSGLQGTFEGATHSVATVISKVLRVILTILIGVALFAKAAALSFVAIPVLLFVLQFLGYALLYSLAFILFLLINVFSSPFYSISTLTIFVIFLVTFFSNGDPPNRHIRGSAIDTKGKLSGYEKRKPRRIEPPKGSDLPSYPLRKPNPRKNHRDWNS